MSWRKARQCFSTLLLMFLAFFLLTNFYDNQQGQGNAEAYGDYVLVQDVTVLAEGKEVIFARPLIIAQNRLLIPLRAVGEALGAQFEWHGASRTIEMIKGERHVLMWPSVTYVQVNGEAKTVQVPPLLHNGSTYVPLAFVSEVTGNQVEWVDASRTVLITGPEPTSPSPSLAGISAEARDGWVLWGLKIGDSAHKVVQTLGEPNRVDPGEYGYQWWVYNSNPERLIMVGVGDGQVRALFSPARDLAVGNIAVGTTYTELSRKVSIKRQVSFSIPGGHIRFNLTQEDVQTRPLLIDGDEAVIFYIDRHWNNRVSAIFLMDVQALFDSQRYGYEISTYNQSVFRNWSQGNRVTSSVAVAQAYERQVLDLTNMARSQFIEPTSILSRQRGVPAGSIILRWHEPMADLARAHSRDMAVHRFFSHTSPYTGALADRLKSSGVPYWHGGENLAMGQADAIDAHFGWMNSAGHRENLLSPTYNGLGVGVVYGQSDSGKNVRYFTQNFINQ
ncbi:hypothetical protein F9B85_03315 [Heliorestis acidaminivorans]|uniref:Copper amine oxidase n=1 Tax=Heliorestis acidaminivorans TaxID=553427 RepID=A0A6I0F2L8_9FIRM|nr:CAP-associated domain-containing protein [Heliorestis acidaminivorans]KAB2953663.1 hypothetical protein F9B85_03315 [Heliorestis acidaminivorans]